jgi:hypothetical protein
MRIINKTEQVITAVTHLSCVEQVLATFSLPQAALAIHIFVEGRREKLIMSCAVSETVFL